MKTSQAKSFLEQLLYQRIQTHKTLCFVQIGANDGRSFDPIYRFVTDHQQFVKGVVVEPLRDLFEELKANYRSCSNITPVNVAIHNSRNERIIYRVDPEQQNLPCWRKGIGSFNKNHHKLSGTPTAVIRQEKVQCVTLKELIETYEFESIDLLQIDTEGYDAEIIMNIDFATLKPAIINFEHGLPDGIMSQRTFASVVTLLEHNGYDIDVRGYDATAFIGD